MTSLSKSKAKARLWLAGLSEKIVHYGNIFDVMAQHHPEYVSLAWGTFKLLFIVSIAIPRLALTLSHKLHPQTASHIIV
jgi:hypothetical protein